MAQAAAIVLADGQPTPVNVTFNPERVTPEVSVFADRTTGVSVKYPRLSLRFAQSGTKVLAGFNVSYPVWGTLPSGAEGVLRTLRAKVSYELPDGCTDAERKNLHAFTKNGLAQTLIQGLMRDLDPLY